MKKDIYLFPAVFDYADDGISIFFPDLPGCLSCANTDEEALSMAKDALCGYLLCSEDFGDITPEPTPLNQVVTEENQRSALISVNLALHRDAFRKQSIKKTLTIPRWLNEAANNEGLNFSQVLQEALVEKLKVS
ncbi:MAG: type II toxin-antitoxin system HicB family antitoxin [Eubacterium sp.]